jgi:hypothetical protein
VKVDLSQIGKNIERLFENKSADENIETPDGGSGWGKVGRVCIGAFFTEFFLWCSSPSGA